MRYPVEIPSYRGLLIITVMAVLIIAVGAYSKQQMVNDISSHLTKDKSLYLARIYQSHQQQKKELDQWLEPHLPKNVEKLIIHDGEGKQKVIFINNTDEHQQHHHHRNTAMQDAWQGKYASYTNYLLSVDGLLGDGNKLIVHTLVPIYDNDNSLKPHKILEVVFDLTSSMSNIGTAQFVLVVVVIAIAILALFMIFSLLNNYQQLFNKQSKTIKHLQLLNKNINKVDSDNFQQIHELSSNLKILATELIKFTQGTSISDTPTYAAEQYRNLIGYAHTTGTQMINLINSVLDHTKMHFASCELSYKKVKLEEVIKSCIDSITAVSERFGLRLSFASPNTSISLSTDDKYLHRIIISLLATTIKNSNSGSSIIISVICDHATNTTTMQIETISKSPTVITSQQSLEESLSSAKQMSKELGYCVEIKQNTAGYIISLRMQDN